MSSTMAHRWCSVFFPLVRRLEKVEVLLSSPVTPLMRAMSDKIGEK